MRKMLRGMAVVAALCTASASQAATIVFGSNAGDIGASQKTYSSGPYSVFATGCTNLVGLTCSFTHIYEKSGGSDESGVGLANDPQGQGEIWNDQSGGVNAIVLDVAGLSGAASASFVMNSVTDGEDFNVLAYDTSTSAWVKLFTGSADGTYALPGFGTYELYAFTTDGTVTAGKPNSFGNVLLSAIVIPDVPEPATWAMMLLGFGGIGLAMRRRPTVKIAQVA